MPKRITCLALLLLATTGCGRPAHVRAPGTRRIVSLAPNLTEIVCALGAESEMVGRSSACDYPPSVVTNVPAVGGFGEPSLELLLASKPTVILEVDMADKPLRHRINELGLNMRTVECLRLGDIAGAVRECGSHIGREQEADSLATALETSLSELEQTRPPASRQPTVFVEIWGEPVTTAGTNTFVSELIHLAGGRNLGDEVSEGYFQSSSEWVISKDPDVIVCLYMTEGGQSLDRMKQRPGWKALRAIETGAVYDGLDADLLLRPGLRVVDGVKELRKCLTKHLKTVQD